MPDLPLLDEALAYLLSLCGDQPSPEVARERLGALRERHPGVRFRLLWQRETYDGSLQYDLLIMRPPGGTVSLSYCPDGALPWSLRGGHRASERLLLRVNGVCLEVDQVVAYLDFIGDLADGDWTPMAERLINACLIQAELEEEPIQMSDAELQEAMDAFRRARGLLTTAETRKWMERRCLSQQNLEELVAGEAAVGCLRRRKTAGHARAFLEQEGAAFDEATVDRAERQLFAEWLTERRQSAKIEWLWGRTDVGQR